MARFFYSVAFCLALPLIWLRLLWRARRQPAYLAHWGERHGHYPAAALATLAGQPVIWVHAVSVGETRAAQPLLAALAAAWPDHRILLTAMTPTGRDTAQALYGDTVTHGYLPYDLPFTVDRFLAKVRPRFGILMETEIWPNLLAAAARRAIPVYLANARLSARSARGYTRFAALARPAFAALAGVAAQTPDDAKRLTALGARPVSVCGNLKFDVTPDPAALALGASWRQALGQRAVCLFASTREGEESLLLDTWRALAGQALIVVVPRHPQRFDEVADLLAAAGLPSTRRSQGLPDSATVVWLGDSMGEMAAYYRLADLAFIGGSLLPLGGQNLIEAAACGCPVLFGPHMFNFAQAARDALAAGAARQVAETGALTGEMAHLLAEAPARQRMQQAATAFAEAHRGAAARTLAAIAGWQGRVLR